MKRKTRPKADPKTYGQLSKDAYLDNAKITSIHGFVLDPELSDKETKVFVNESTKKIVIAYRGTASGKDLISDVAIATGTEGLNPRFKGAVKKFDTVRQKYGDGYTYDTTGHSLGGQLATYVDRHRYGQVDENLAYSRGSGVGELFRSRPSNTYDYSNSKDIISLGARLNSDGSLPVKVFNLATKSPLELAWDVVYKNFIGGRNSFVRNDLNTDLNKAHAIDLTWM